MNYLYKQVYEFKLNQIILITIMHNLNSALTQVREDPVYPPRVLVGQP